MTTSRLILNGKGAGDSEVRDAVHRARDDGHTVGVRCTWERGDARRFAEQAVDDGVDILIAGGGDGTIHEIVNGLMAADGADDVVLGVLPMGTANDFARGCRLPMEPGPALELALAGTPVPVDVPSANGVCFLNLASGGFAAEVTADTPESVKKLIGGGAYALAGVVTAARLTPYEGELEIAGDTIREPFIAFALGNGCYAGGGLPVTPEAVLDDGLIDVIVVHDFQAGDLREVLGELGDFAASENRFVRYRQVDRLRLEVPEPMPINLDGEPYEWDRIDFEIRPRALRVVLPEDCPLIGRG
jgi:lipid kinase YegS